MKIVRRSWAIALVAAAVASSGMGCGNKAAPDDHEATAAPPPPAASADAHAAHGASSATPGGMAPFRADVKRLTALGLETVAVEHAAARRAIRTVGVVGVDETRVTEVLITPHPFQELIARQHGIGMVGKLAQQPELGFREAEFLASP